MKRILLGLAIVLAGCNGGGEAPPAESGEAIASADELAAARSEAEKQWPSMPQAKNVVTAPTTPICSTTLCAVAKVQFVNHDWPKAWSGDYAAQRNVAFCRQSGCSMAVQINEIEACAWRQVILETHASEIDQTDRDNFEVECGSLSATDMAQARREADQIKLETT